MKAVFSFFSPALVLNLWFRATVKLVTYFSFLSSLTSASAVSLPVKSIIFLVFVNKNFFLLSFYC